MFFSINPQLISNLEYLGLTENTTFFKRLPKKVFWKYDRGLQLILGQLIQSW